MSVKDSFLSRLFTSSPKVLSPSPVIMVSIALQFKSISSASAVAWGPPAVICVSGCISFISFASAIEPLLLEVKTERP